MVLPRAVILAAILSLAAGSPARGHGAAVGLHVHVPDGGYRPGHVLRFQVHARESIRSLTIAFVGEAPVTVTPRRPTRHLKLKLRIPEGLHDETTGLQAEGTTDQGTVVRAAAVVRLRQE